LNEASPDPDGDGEEPEAPQPPPKRPSRRRWLWWPLPVALAVVAALFGVDRVHQHVERAEFCESCHVKDVHQLAASVHKSLPCTACHDSHFGQNLHQWALGMISSSRTTAHGRVAPSRCRSCHTSSASKSANISLTNGHQVHVLKAHKPLPCFSCHTWSDHRTMPKPEACAGCHEGVHTFGKHATAFHGKALSCLSCHNYLARIENGVQTPAERCQYCHGGAHRPQAASRFAEFVQGVPILPSMIHGNMETCDICHRPHQQAQDQRFLGEQCTLCHGKVTSEFHRTKMPDRFTCTTCHKPHGPRTSLVTACLQCHTDKLEHGMLAAKHSRCSQCHKAHTWQASVESCRDCHAEKALELASWDAKVHNECLNCHKPHEAREPASFCTTCHHGKGANAHPACTTCHDPHQSVAHVKACGGCHAGELTTLAFSAPRHRAGCTTCHQPHSPLTALKACNSCHADKFRLVSLAKPAPHQQCVSCHKPHMFAASVSACSACHHNPTTGPHTGACTQCHQPHGQPLGKASSCKNCHAGIAPAGHHSRCQTCHREAHGAGLMAPTCGTCHQAKAQAVSTWPPNSHVSCQNCHQKHDPTHPKACAECHAAEARQVAPTRHTCNSCHDVHARLPQNFWSACTRCHSAEVNAVIGRGPTHSVCGSCHKPHGFAPPTCTSCHQSLPAAHRIHAAKTHCTDCHQVHARTVFTRTTCLRCHTDKVNHFPNAPSCASCHLFTAP
jgi:Cytochrome c3